MRKEKHIFSCIDSLHEALDTKGKLRILHPGKIWEASFEWIDPISTDMVKRAEARFGRTLPEDYVVFLTTISDGATLYYDARYGQWGYKIYGIEEIVEKQMEWKGAFQDDWLQNYVAVGRIIGESHPLIMDLCRPTKDGKSCAMVDGNPLDPPSSWPGISRSFHEWLENLITAQGAKYWLWK